MMSDPKDLRPPEKWAHLRWHWIASPGHPEGEVMQWTSDKCWWSTEDDSDLWPDRMDGYSYLRPCSPDAIVIDAGDLTLLQCLSEVILTERGKRTASAEPWHVRAARTVLAALATHGKGDGT
jgi:hypothetical protein